MKDTNLAFQQNVKNLEQSVNKNKPHRVHYCSKDENQQRFIEPLEAITMNKIDGKIICGKRAGFPFTDVLRPDLGTGLCPNNTAPCSNATNLYNTICYPEE